MDDCDDGNNINGDGCSSKCKLEKNYVCKNGGLLVPNICKYVRRDIVLSVVRVDRVDFMNQANFTLAFSPNLYPISNPYQSRHKKYKPFVAMEARSARIIIAARSIVVIFSPIWTC